MHRDECRGTQGLYWEYKWVLVGIMYIPLVVGVRVRVRVQYLT